MTTLDNCPYCRIDIPLEKYDRKSFQWHLNGHGEETITTPEWEKRLRELLGEHNDLLFNDKRKLVCSCGAIEQLFSEAITAAREEELERIVGAIQKAEPRTPKWLEKVFSDLTSAQAET